MPKPKRLLITRLRCDKMWGRYTTSWLAHDFPELKGKELTFRSDRAVEFVHAPLLLEWLQVNRYI